MTLARIILLALPFLLSIPGAALADTNARELISRYLEWRGGTAVLGKMDSIDQSGNITVAGLNGGITLSQRRDGYLYQSFDLGVFKGTEVSTPTDHWSINASGQVEDLGITNRQTHGRTLATTFLDTLLGESTLDQQLMEPGQRDGKDYAVLRLAYAYGDYMDMFIDPQSGAHAWTRELTDGKTIWHKLADWRLVDNIRFPFHEKSIHEDAAENSEITWQNIEINNGAGLSRYVRPAQAADTGGIEGGVSTRWLPMQTYLNRYIFIEGTVNGHETAIVLDSGAGITVLDQRFADAAGIEGQGALQAKGASGAMVASMTDGISITLDTLRLKNLTAAILDLSEVSRGLGRDIPVILGKEVFNNFIVDIDYPGQRIAFHQHQGYDYAGPGKALTLFPGDDGHKLLDISMEGHPPARVTLDTGSGLTLTLFKAYWDDTHHLLDDGRAVSDSLTGGVGGYSVSTVSSLESVTIAGHQLNNVPVEFYADSAGSFNTRRLAGNLGAGILNRFRVIFDYSQDRLILEASAGATMKPFDRNRVGLQLKRLDGKLNVVHVASGSPAEKAGWHKGDVLAAADGQPLNEHYREHWHKLSTAAPGTTLVLQKSDGTKTPVVLADYY